MTCMTFYSKKVIHSRIVVFLMMDTQAFDDLPDLLGEQNVVVENRNLKEHLHRLAKQLQVYKQNQSALKKEVNSMQANEDFKRASVHDIEQDNKMLIHRVLEQEEEMRSLRERLHYQQEKSTDLSKQLFSIKMEKGLDAKSLKLREENQALKKELIIAQTERNNPNGVEDSSDDKRLLETAQDETIGLGKELSNHPEDETAKRMGMEGLRWQLWASKSDDDHDKTESTTSKMKWTQARVAGDPDFVSFQNEVEEVCQEINDKTNTIQQLRRHIRQKEADFTETFGKHLVHANESLAKVKEDAAAEIDTLQKQVKDIFKLEEENKKQLKTIETLEVEREKSVELFAVAHSGLNQHIQALEQTIDSQDRIIDNMTEEIGELQSSMAILSDRRRCEVEDMELEMTAHTAKAKEAEQMVARLKDLMETRRIDYLAQVESCQILIDELESEGPLTKMIQELEKTEIVTEIRRRLGSLKSMNKRLHEDNLRLGFKLDGAVDKLKSFQKHEKELETLRTESASLAKQLKEVKSSTRQPIHEENWRLKEKVYKLENKLRQEKRDLLREQAKEWQQKTTEVSSVSSSFGGRWKIERDEMILDKLHQPPNASRIVQMEKFVQISAEQGEVWQEKTTEVSSMSSSFCGRGKQESDRMDLNQINPPTNASGIVQMEKGVQISAEQGEAWQEKTTEVSSMSFSFCGRGKQESDRMVMDQINPPTNASGIVQMEKGVQISREVEL